MVTAEVAVFQHVTKVHLSEILQFVAAGVAALKCGDKKKHCLFNLLFLISSLLLIFKQTFQKKQTEKNFCFFLLEN